MAVCEKCREDLAREQMGRMQALKERDEARKEALEANTKLAEMQKKVKGLDALKSQFEAMKKVLG